MHYITTPIYYVNDRPHIGHCYSTLLADVAARMRRLIDGQAVSHREPSTEGKSVFFLTGTDEHAEKVSKTAAERGVTPMEWATTNAERFKDAFAFMGFSNDDFVRTTEDRHIDRASAYIQRLVDSGDIELGDYEGWYDPSQEEYVTETVAKEHDFNSPVTGRPLEKRVEQNYFFRLDKYEAWLTEQIESGAIRVLPEARKNEVMGRIRQGLNKVPVSRRIKEGDADWGIRMPNDPEHRIYVWIEALCNYLTMVDQPDRRKFWPGGRSAFQADIGEQEESARRADLPAAPVTHMMAKDILWFHAVIWPCMLRALGERPPETVYAHAYWIAEGRKMSKSLGNFIEIDQLRAYAERYSLDAVRWFLTTQGPLGATDADFAHGRFVEVYNAELANGIGNATSRVANMIGKYFGGKVPDPDGIDTFDTGHTWRVDAEMIQSSYERDVENLMDVRHALEGGTQFASQVDGFINETRPFSLAKAIDDAATEKQLRVVLYQCAEALRIASLLLYPAMPAKMADLWRRWNCSPLVDPADPDSGFRAPLAELATWAHPEWGLKPGQSIEKGDALFMRADVNEEAPGG